MTTRSYITTPIYYVNAPPHLGHAYTTIVADVINRFHKLMGKETFFLTGTDEHGDKVVEAAAAAGKDPQSYADEISALFRNIWPKLRITNNYFIRTTDEAHKRVVQYILQKVYDSGDIYFSSYSGQYCVGCERFYTERELVDGKCPQHDRAPVLRHEENYFFRMSKYQDWLIDHINNNPDFIRPERYRNEVLSFLNEPLDDLCISRPKSRLSWGITLPFDDRYVTYVWFDALINYVSALGYPDGELYQRFWPVAQHLIAKDILKPHGIYWPTMLKAANIPLYRHLNVHGYWNVDEKKMSKSRGTVVKPLDLLKIYGLDAFRYFLMREMVFGLDANFSEEALINRINADLANDFGNLASRLLTMVKKYCDGKVPAPASLQAEDTALREAAMQLHHSYVANMEELQFHKALMELWAVINLINRYIDQCAPWVLARDDSSKSRLHTVLNCALEALKIVTVLLAPVMPAASEDLLSRLGLQKDSLDLRLARDASWGTLIPGTAIRRGKPLFPRVDKISAMAAAGPQSSLPQLAIDEFARLDLRVAEIMEAESIPGSNKLLKLQVDMGETRTIVAGIAQSYKPAELKGKQVIVVANLKPATLMGVRSEGMVLAASDGSSLTLVTPEEKMKPGTPVK
ncbi:MAG: methionine--tRNA ligase [Deltaproteobacteria bacterium]|nr:methionine--tRNA ligase [Deltaproteobacteria bacterium]MBW2069682.1 methionine--tRNA ligase [Deltaproteobacteria bacterium]